MSTQTTTPPDAVSECVTGLCQLENLWDVPALVEAITRFVTDPGWCSCADDPQVCTGCLVTQRLAAHTIPAQLTAVTR